MSRPGLLVQRLAGPGFLREHVAVGIVLLADEAGEFGQGVFLVRVRVRRLAQATLQGVEVRGRTLLGCGLAHKLTSCGDRGRLYA